MPFNPTVMAHYLSENLTEKQRDLLAFLQTWRTFLLEARPFATYAKTAQMEKGVSAVFRNNLRCVALAGIAGLGGLSAITSSAHASIVYHNNFDSGDTTGWSTSTTDVTPSGRRFLGQFGNGGTALTLNGLTVGETLRLEFDFYAIHTWDGESTLWGPDTWRVGVVGGAELLIATFAVGDASYADGTQSYPGTEGGGTFPGRFMANENNTLGYLYMGTFQRDAVWHVVLDTPVTDPSMTVSFEGSGLQPLFDESWGLDGFTASVVPAPGSLALAGLAGLAWRRRR